MNVGGWTGTVVECTSSQSLWAENGGSSVAAVSGVIVAVVTTQVIPVGCCSGAAQQGRLVVVLLVVVLVGRWQLFSIGSGGCRVGRQTGKSGHIVNRVQTRCGRCWAHQQT